MMKPAGVEVGDSKYGYIVYKKNKQNFKRLYKVSIVEYAKAESLYTLLVAV